MILKLKEQNKVSMKYSWFFERINKKGQKLKLHMKKVTLHTLEINQEGY
jgi:SHS2 domain-containing protein